jgi:type I restriction enzyme S subunit
MNDWPHKALADLFRVCSSKRVLKSEWQQEGVPFYRGREITALSRDGRVDSALFISEEHFEVLVQNYGVPKCGDIMITAIGTIGNSYIVKQSDRFYFKDASVLWLDKKSDIQSKYVQHWITSSGFKEQLNSGNGATVDTLTIDGLSKMRIPVPPLEEQKRIVALLDAATARVAELTECYEKARTHANNLFTSALQSELKGNPDWPVKTLGDVVRFDSETVRPEDLSSDDVYVGLENIAGNGTLIGLGNVSAETLKSNKARFTDNHILFGKLRPYLVKVVRPAFSGVCSTDILPLQPTAQLSRDFLYWYMRSPAVIEAATEASTGTTLPRVSPTTLKSFVISVPPLEEQKRIVELLDSMRRKTTAMDSMYDAKLQAAKDLRQSILEAAFRGDL